MTTPKRKATVAGEWVYVGKGSLLGTLLAVQQLPKRKRDGLRVTLEKNGDIMVRRLPRRAGIRKP